MYAHSDRTWKRVSDLIALCILKNLPGVDVLHYSNTPGSRRGQDSREPHLVDDKDWTISNAQREVCGVGKCTVDTLNQPVLGGIVEFDDVACGKLGQVIT